MKSKVMLIHAKYCITRIFDECLYTKLPMVAYILALICNIRFFALPRAISYM